MIHTSTLIAILVICVVTYLCRIMGYLVLRRMNLSAKAMAVLEASPGCVLIAVISPAFASDRPADLIALAITVFAATRFSMMPTVLIGLSSAAMMRFLLPV